ncbi:hypothetical protein [Desulfurobacterium crinifex]
MDLRRRIEKLEKELKKHSGDDNKLVVLVRETTFSKSEERALEQKEKELLERLKEYPNAKIVIAVVTPKGWEIEIPELGVKESSKEDTTH